MVEKQSGYHNQANVFSATLISDQNEKYINSNTNIIILLAQNMAYVSHISHMTDTK
jgi:hypothetical protein